MCALMMTLVASLLAARTANTSTYTKLDKASCKLVETHEEGGYTLQRCRGVSGLDLVLQSFDSRDDVRLARSSGEDDLHLDNVTPAFNSVGEVVEWRMAGKSVVALILRLLVDETNDPNRPRSHPFLIVAKVRPAGSCVVGVVDARAVRDANVQARSVADSPQARSCLWP
jgi:hypothetical protein